MTLAVSFTFDEAAVHRLKEWIPWQDRTWHAADKTWYVKPRHLAAVKTFARLFDSAMLIEGHRWEDLRTGRVFEQGTLF